MCENKLTFETSIGEFEVYKFNSGWTFSPVYFDGIWSNSVYVNPKKAIAAANEWADANYEASYDFRLD